MRRSRSTLRPGPALALITLAACSPPDFERLGALTVDDLPPSPTNAWADDPEAAVLGRALFFDPRMSADGAVSCATCHDPAHAFADPKRVSTGSFGRVGARHAPSLLNVAFGEFQLWDGRADSLWAQPIKAIENPDEGDFTRTELAHFVAAEYRAAYVAVFGPLPTLNHLPAIARPGDATWDTMSASDRDAVNRIAANVGKAIEAYERELLCVDTAFDRFMLRGDDLGPLAEAGAREFLERGPGCADCHGGPNLSDGRFHNLGLDHGGAPDPGRSEGIERLLSDEFNGAGRYSDDPEAGAARLADVALGRSDDLGAFKTPSLRGVAQRDRFGHLGHSTRLDDWIDDVYDRPARRRADFVGELSPDFPRGRGDTETLVAFLRTLSCPPLPAELLGPPDPSALPGAR